MSSSEDVLERVAYLLNDTERPLDRRLYDTLRLLCKHRSQLLAGELAREGGLEVRSGPFKGLRMPPEVAEGCFVPKLLGTYEQDLHRVLRCLPERGYDAVLNIGCAEGYYAVGLARLLPGVRVEAYDTDAKARRICAELAAANGMGDRIRIGATFAPEHFARYEGQRVCVVCDIEGAEAGLLDPARAPALRGMDLLVETHDVFVPGCTATLLERFHDSHGIERIAFAGRTVDGLGELRALENLDQLLAVWEWRLQGNDWMWMQARRAAGPAVCST